MTVIKSTVKKRLSKTQIENTGQGIKFHHFIKVAICYQQNK